MLFYLYMYLTGHSLKSQKQVCSSIFIMPSNFEINIHPGILTAVDGFSLHSNVTSLASTVSLLLQPSDRDISRAPLGTGGGGGTVVVDFYNI